MSDHNVKFQFTQVPNLVLDMQPYIDKNEFLIMTAAIRQIIGYEDNRLKPAVPMSVSWFQAHTNLSKNSVRKGIQLACERGWLICTDRGGRNRSAHYCLAWQREDWEAQVAHWRRDTPLAPAADEGGSISDPKVGQPMTQDNEQTGSLSDHSKRKDKESKRNIVSGETLPSATHVDDDAAEPDLSAVKDPLMNNEQGRADVEDAHHSNAHTEQPDDDSFTPPRNMMALFHEVFSRTVDVSVTQQKRLLKPIRYKTGDGAKVTLDDSLEDLAANNRDFRTFVTNRLKAFKQMYQQKGQSPSVKSMVTNLMNVKRQGKTNAWDGWLVYQDKRTTRRHDATGNASHRQTKGAVSTYKAGTLPPPPEEDE